MAQRKQTRSGRARLGGRRLKLETLENRAMMTTLLYSIDGSGNNLANPDWGSAGIEFLRQAAAEYADGASSGVTDRPSAREISNVLAAQGDNTATNARDLSNFVYAWGQFIDHDLDLTLTATPAENLNIAVPTGDAYFDPRATGTAEIPLTRSQSDSEDGVRDQINSINAFLDGSMVYGVSAEGAAALRTFSGGKLKIGDGNLLPSDPATGDGASAMFLAGDVRANENIELTAMHVLFMREHNRIADSLAASNPSLTDEQIYQQARRTVIAEIQSITFNEFLPALLGENAIRKYSGYDATVNPGIANEFATAAYRFGHSMVGNDVEFLDNNGNEVREEVTLAEAFFNPALLRATGIDSVLKYLASANAEEIDTKVVDSLRNFLFGPPGAGGLDLAALNIQRGRDHGLADYNSVREAYGLPKVTSFAEVTSNVELQQKLEAIYGTVDNIDLWVGGLAEDHVPGGSLGATFTRVIADQFQRLRDGDRLWYQATFKGAELKAIECTTLADVIRRNTGLTNLQANVFVFKAEVSGKVFVDGNRDGRLNPGEQGVAGRTIQLLSAEGALLATTVTDRNGVYRFDDLQIGNYQIKEVPPAGAQAAPTRSFSVTRGMSVSGQDFAEAPLVAPKPPAPAPAPVPSAGPRCAPPPPRAVDAVFANNFDAFGRADALAPQPPKRR